jgi:hypothetical protein
MKKYRTTRKHPAYRENLLIQYDNDGQYGYRIIEDSNGYFSVYNYIMSESIEKGWIEEIKEPEFTKNDMIDFARYYISGCSLWTDEEKLNIWLKLRDENKNQQ